MGSILLTEWDSPSLYCIDLGSPTDVVRTEYPHFQWPDGVELRSGVELIGSCRNLLCISLGDLRHFAILKPATMKPINILPLPILALYHDMLNMHSQDFDTANAQGFGYDDRKKEFVLLMLNQTLELPLRSEVSIYRYRSRSNANEWRQLQGMPYYLFRQSALFERPAMGVFLHCHLHWIMTRELTNRGARRLAEFLPRAEEYQEEAEFLPRAEEYQEEYRENLAKVLVAFNIRTERFEEIELPNLTNNRLRMDLAVLGEHLCLIIYKWRRGVNVWIMREYGWNGPWDRLFSIGEHQWDTWRIRTIKPLAYSQNRDRVLVDVNHNRFLWYDLQTRDIEEFHGNGMPDFFNAATCL